MTVMAKQRPAAERELLQGKEALLRILEEGRLRPHFQAVVDLFSAEILGYEALARPDAPFAEPLDMMAQAEEWNIVWAVEHACRAAALTAAATWPLAARRKKIFLNVNPAVFHDERFRAGTMPAFLRELGLDPRQVVIEISERYATGDLLLFEEGLRHYVDQGFQIALDDFGAGQSSLATLVAASPHYLKIDPSLIREIDRKTSRQKAVRAVLSFAADMGSRVIAEGVETREEFETLMRLGLRFAQGFYFAAPAPGPEPILPVVRERMRETALRFHYPRISPERSIIHLAIRPPAFEAGTLTGAELDRRFQQSPALDHVVLCRASCPVALLTRQHFYAQTGGPFGYSLVQRKPVDGVAREDALTVRENIDISLLARLAMERGAEELYDPVIVTDARGELVGTVTMKQLLSKSTTLEVEIASNANPLSGLPGNVMIQRWLQEALDQPAFALVYADLDHFKEYNDVYGFSQGDEMIRLAAKTLGDHAAATGAEARLGHVGGDDFVIVLHGAPRPEALEALCRVFDREKAALFDLHDMERGWYSAVDRQGKTVEIPLVTLSLAVITSQNLEPGNRHPGAFSRAAAAVKKEVKRLNESTGTSGFLIDRRRSGSPPESSRESNQALTNA